MTTPTSLAAPRRRSQWHMWARVIGLVSLITCVLPAVAYGQSKDPCHLSLASQADALAEYDRLVGVYLDVSEAGDHLATIEALDALWATCNRNLRVQVFRAQALLRIGNCAEAAHALDYVASHAASWDDPDNSRDALERAESARASLRAQCFAHVEVRCATPSARVRVGVEPETACPAAIDLAAGEHEVAVRAEGMAGSLRTYTLAVGNNFIEVEALQPLSNSTTGADAEAALNEKTGGDDVAQVDEGANFVVTCAPNDVTLAITANRQTRREACPAALELPRGSYQVVATAPGHQTVSQVLDVVGGRRTEAVFALEPRRAWGVRVRVAVGAGQELKRTTSETGTSFDTTSESQVALALRAEGLFQLNPDGPHGLEVGPMVRLAFGDSDGALVGGALDYLFAEQSLFFFGGLEGGYGTVGFTACTVDGGACRESAGAYGGLRVGGGLAWAGGWSAGMFAAFLFGEMSVADIALTIEYGF